MSAVSNVHGSMIMEVQSHALGEGEAPRLPMGGEGEALFVMQQHLASPAGQLVQRAVRMQQLQMHVFDSVFELTEASSGCSARPRTSYEGALERRRAAMERTLESVQQLFTFQREMLSDLSKAQFSLVQYQTWNPLCGHTERVFFHKCKLCTQQFSTAYGTRIADPFNRAGEQADSKDYVSISDSANELFNMIDFDACCPARICNTSSTSSESVEHGGDNKETGLRTLAATWAEDVGVFCDQSAGEQELETDIKRKLLFFEHCRELFNGLFAKETVNDVAIEVNAKEVVSELSRAVMDLPVGQSLIVPVTPKKHIAVLEIRKTGESKFSLAYFNTSPPAKSDAHVEAVKEK